MIKLYHYVHCPFCVRVRMGFGALGLPFESQVLPYHDEKTPIEKTGIKMLPFIVDDAGAAMNESLDILRRFDQNNQLHFDLLDQKAQEMELLMDEIASPVHNLAMPYWIWTPEFNQDSRQYFVTKKSKKRGPFHLLVQKRKEFEAELIPILKKIEGQLRPFYQSDRLSVLDIMVAAHLWGLFILPEFQFSPALYEYLMKVKDLTHFNYHEDFWKRDIL